VVKNGFFFLFFLFRSAAATGGNWLIRLEGKAAGRRKQRSQSGKAMLADCELRVIGRVGGRRKESNLSRRSD